MKKQNAFLDRIKAERNLKTDLQASIALRSDPSTISRARNANIVSSDLILNAHLLTNIPVLELQELANKAV